MADRVIRTRFGHDIDDEMIKEMDLFSGLINQEIKNLISEIYKDYTYYEIDDELGDVPKKLSEAQMKNYISSISIFINFEEQIEYGVFVTPLWDEEHPPTYVRVNGVWDRLE